MLSEMDSNKLGVQNLNSLKYQGRYNIQEFMNKTWQIDDYTIYGDQKLGQGSFGKVYKGIKKSTSQPVAIKIIKKEKYYNHYAQEQQIMKEIKIMGKLNHQHIVRFYDALKTDNNYYIIEELCDGDLASYLKKNRKSITQSKAIDILRQICSGCLYLIRRGIVHRDLKPKNIMISGKTFKIGDFGLAKMNITRNFVNQSIVGTPGYMALEIMEKNNYNSKCDIWSIGIIFFQILHGELPWDGNDLQEIKQNTFKTLLHISQKYSYLTMDFLRRCLEKKQANRFSWEQMLSHPIFNRCFKSYGEHIQEMQKKHKEIAYLIGKKIISLPKNKEWISFGEFKQMLAQFKAKWDDQQIRYSFQSLDLDGDGKIYITQVEKAYLKAHEKILRDKSNQLQTQKKRQRK